MRRLALEDGCYIGWLETILAVALLAFIRNLSQQLLRRYRV